MEAKNELYGNVVDWNAPDGNTYSIREQNGADDDILSNPSKAEDLTNLAEFISAIVVGINGESKRLTIKDVMALPVNVRYGISLVSRINSFGAEMEFSHQWPREDEPQEYAVDLTQFIFNDYHVMPTAEELMEKVDAIPFYPPLENYDGFVSKDIEVTLPTSGIRIMFDRYNGEAERETVKMPREKLTLNRPLLARNLRVHLNNQWTKVESFHMFTAKQMKELREAIYSIDPVFTGDFLLTNQRDSNINERVILFGIKDFFYPGEA